MKGWIALDIDGTITGDKYSVPGPVVDYLRELQNKGWNLAIATGRSCGFALKALSTFDFPYRLLVQNGSAALAMPSKDLLYKCYLSESAIALMEKAFEGIVGNFLVYSGIERGGKCYYRPDQLSKAQREYVSRLEEREAEAACPVDTFHEIEDFPLIKCFGSESEMIKLANKLRQIGIFQVAHIRDPFEKNGQLLLVTDFHASKGETLQAMMLREGRGPKVIAAADDENDISLLEQADVKIVMPQAPALLKKQADFVAPPVSELGIITALKWATHNAD
ncbi:MAG TPA: hypothetical protein DCE71_08490 [Parachlamydiales bacterium]|nr:hypothetical protein [Parachlamydiales bacterium]